MSIRQFLSKQFIDVIHWVEPEEGILAFRTAAPSDSQAAWDQGREEEQ